jgi:PLP dependent protein
MTAKAGAETEGLRARLEQARGRIEAAARRAGRDPAGVTLVAVSKTHPPQLIGEAVAAGIRQFGENKVQEAEGKIDLIGRGGDVRWHLIGHLQSNKVRRGR